jgi:hypothetical protein
MPENKLKDPGLALHPLKKHSSLLQYGIVYGVKVSSVLTPDVERKKERWMNGSEKATNKEWLIRIHVTGFKWEPRPKFHSAFPKAGSLRKVW